MKRKIILSIALFAVLLFLVGVFTQNYTLRMVSKPVPVLALLALLKPNTNYRKLIFTGLVLSLVGDVLLESSPSMFVFGLLAFLSAHIAYIVAFIRRSRELVILPAVVFLVFGVAIFTFLYPGLGTMVVPVIVYITAIILMAWRSIAQRKVDGYAIFAAVGALFFVFSDSLIAFNKFYEPIPAARWLIIVTYWTAQYLIFYSAFKETRQ